MKKELSRMDTLKERADQKNTAMDIFGEKEGEFFFLDSIASKEKLLDIDEVAYNNIIMKFKFDENNNPNEIYQRFDLMVNDFLKLATQDISFFIFSKKAYEVTVSPSLFLKKYARIKEKLSHHDIIIHKKDLTSGLCLLVDEHYISISLWNN